ncbi:MAG: FlgD immunoglobulin-like domain containing protein, partial [Terriglobia bacterium]
TDFPVNYTPGIVTIDVPPCLITNCGAAGGNVLYGRPYTFDFNSDQDPVVQYSVTVGPGSINAATGVYSFSGQCPLGAIPVTVRATDPSTQKFCDCQFTLNIIDNAPSCTPAQPTVTVSHGALATNQINTSDPDAGDVVSVAQTSGPGSTTGGGAWSYQTGCSDVGASPQTVQHQVVDGFANCQPGPLSATCQFQLVVTNAAPSIQCPPNSQVQANSAYNANASASDADAADQGNLTFALVSGPAGLTVSPSGAVSWSPGLADAGPHQVCISVTDLCGSTSQCCYTLTVVVGQRFCLKIDTTTAFQGSDVEISIINTEQANDPNTLSNESVGGFSFLLSYDCACLQFLSARKGALLVAQDWEFFTYRYGAIGNGNCGSGCPSCLIRVVAIADVNNGAHHPTQDGTNQGEWVVLKFRTSNDRTLAGNCCPVSWFWFDCTDNTISDSTGNVTWVVEEIFTSSGQPIPLDGTFPVNLSGCDQVSGGPGKPSPKKFICFHNGHICLPHPRDIDDRGDINLNGQPYDIGDAVLFENYFIYGPSVLSSNPTHRQSQIAASDVNGDGLVLSVGDLVALIRVITGDAQPLPSKLNPAAGAVSIALSAAGSEWTLAANSASDMGGLFLKFRVDGSAGAPVLSEAAEGMTVKSNLIGNELSVLIYSEVRDRMIAPNAGAIFTMNVEGSVELIETEAADYYGNTLPALTKATALPTKFGLAQNYPNPFNGKTSFVLALPVSSDYTVTVYNVAGQVVKRFEGSAPAGNKVITWDGTDHNGTAVSSGIYFYKAAAKDFSATMKMLYLK